MSQLDLMVLDLGSTLVGGPEQGPARRIADLAGLDGEQRRLVHRLLMINDFRTPREATTAISERLHHGGPRLERAVHEVWEAQLTEAYLLPHVQETLDALVGRYRLAILSNIWSPFLYAVRARLGDFFHDHIEARLQVFSCQAGQAKPTTKLFTTVLERAGVPPQGAIMVGDSYQHDIEPALALGMRAVWITSDPRPNGKVRWPGATLTGGALKLKSFADLRYVDPPCRT